MIRMQSPFVLTLLASTLLACSAVHADEGMIYHLNNHLEGSIGAEHMSYREFNNGVTGLLPQGGDLDTESGTMAAAQFSAGWQGRLMGMNNVRGEVSLQIGSGDAVYHGYLQNLQTGALSPLRTTTNETFIDLHYRAGKGFGFISGNRDLLTPYFGLDFTSWNRDINGTGGYSEQYEHFDWKLGGQYQIALQQNVTLSVDAGFGKTFSPTMTSSLFSNTFELGEAWMQSYDLGLRYMASKRVYLGLDAWWTHYSYGHSPIYSVDINGQAGGVMEPDSKTVRDGAMVVMGFSYR